MDSNTSPTVRSSSVKQLSKMINLRKLNKNEAGKFLIPNKILKLNLKKELESVYQKIHFDNVNYALITNFFALSVILTMVAYILLYPYLYQLFSSYFAQNFFYKVIIYIISWFVLNLAIYYTIIFGYFMMLDSRFKKAESEIEKDLPEFLDSLVSNLKGGISLEKAIIQSVRKDQKALLKEVTLINEKVMMGKNVIESIREFRQRFNSPIINRTFFLVEEGLQGGGNLSTPLERISDNLKKIYNLDEEIKSNSSGFSVVVSFISIVVAPVLFALALTLLTFIGNLFDLLSESEAVFLSATAIPPEFTTYLTIFSYSMIVMVTFFSSLIVAHLKNEKAYKMIKFLPIYIIVSLLIYNIFSAILLSFFGNII